MKENCTQLIFLFFNCNRWPASKSWHCCLIKIRYSLSIKICSGQCSDADDNLHVPNHHSIDYHQTLGGQTEILGLSRRQLLGNINIILALFFSAVPLNCTMEEIHFTKDTRNCQEKVKKISHLKPNQLAFSIYIMKELCFFSLDQ